MRKKWLALLLTLSLVLSLLAVPALAADDAGDPVNTAVGSESAETADTEGSSGAQEGTEVLSEENDAWHYVNFVWDDGYSTCVAEFTNRETGEVTRIECTITTEEDDDEVLVTATVEFNGETYTDQEWVQKVRASFEWSEDYTACTAIIHRFGQADVSVECTVTSGEVTGDGHYITNIARVEVDGETFESVYQKDNPDLVNLGTLGGSMWYHFHSDGAIDIRGYRSSDNTLVQTTFYNAGYYTVLTYDDPTADDHGYYSNTILFTGNGQGYNDGTLTVTPNVYFSDDGDYAILAYTVTNNTARAVRFSLGMLADVDIDSDDWASVLITSTGVNMVNQQNNENYYLACRNLAGQDSADTLWVGNYPLHWQNVFNNQINDVTNVDSAIALSWRNRTIGAGATTQYHLMVGIGEGTDIQPPDVHYHEYGEPVFNWSGEGIACIAVFTCKTCGSVRNVDCAISSEDEQIIATAYFEDKTYTNVMPTTIVFVDDTTGGIADMGVHVIGSGDDLTLECSIPLEYFESVEMDGVLIDVSNYTLASGSTRLTLSSSYLDTLSVGRHTVTMNYGIEGGSYNVTTMIEIQRRTIDNVPKTGDNSMLAVWVVLALVSLAGMGATVVYSRKIHH